MSKGSDIRPHLKELLDIWERAEGPPPRSTRKQVAVPVVREGKLIRHIKEAASDGRHEGWRSFTDRVRELRSALESGGDAHLIWLALSVGAGSVTIAAREAKYSRDSNAGKGKAGKTKAKEEQQERFLAELKITKGPSYHERVKRASNKSGWPFSISTAERLGKKAGLG